ncbi:TRAP transporter substrate-binding protein [Actinomadura sp. HBU206391]|uniref:TRAP transporter substrate-binding protein n=1 Tax=Actinomadura sp. HBU206391 TaxID=2731692 RepID=UPI0016500ECA|nr:TRAP transporter substrate-binding protein [Actinomadura sp. HBU206391]MBC6456508.1 TRAP transporter substrate-binding protein [Actinomadura sp. HBU206391]
MGLVGLGAVSAPAVAAVRAAQGKVLRVGDTVDAHNPEVVAEHYFLQRLTALSDGRLTGHVYPNAVLGSHDRMNEQLRNATLEVAKTSVANLEVYDRRLGVFALPYAFDTRQRLYAAQDGPLGRRLAAILEGHGLRVLGWFDSGERNIYNTKRALHEPADLRGLKMRVQSNQIMIDTFNTLGAQATPLDTAQIYSALQQGVVDAAENSLTFYVQQHHNEVAKYYSYTRHFFSVDPLLVSDRWFRAQSAADQDAILQAGREAQNKERELWLRSDEQYLGAARQAGSHLNEADTAAFKKAVAGVYARHRSTFGTLLDLTDWR